MMCSLADGPSPPPAGYITLYEEDGVLATVHAADIPSNYTPRGVDFPYFSTTAESLCSLVTNEAARSAFLSQETDVPLWKRAWYTCQGHGLHEMLEELSKNETAPWPVKIFAYGCLSFMIWVNSLRGSLSSQLVVLPKNVFQELSRVNDAEESEVKAFAWHQYANKCAVAWKNNSIKIFMAGSDVVPTLKHRHQRDVSCLAWKPLSAAVLAVGCQSCILIWHIDPTSLSTRPTASAAQVLCHTSHSPVTCLSWDPRGRLLLSASTKNTAVLVWDVPRESFVPLRRAGGGAVSLLIHSPDGAKVFVSTSSQVFRVWETRTWTCEKWTELSGPCQSACWSVDGQFLLFCTENEPAIFSLNFSQGESGAETAIHCADVSEVEVECHGQQKRVGGLIQDMAWNSTGERLAVLFKGNGESEKRPQIIALFMTKVTPMLQLIPSGFIQGEPGEIPKLISFKPTFEHGALLTVCWQSGKITFVPLCFIQSSTLPENGNEQPNSTTNPTPVPQQLFSVRGALN